MYLWLEISVNISKLVELVDSHEHFCGVKLGMFLFKDTRVIQQCPEISSWDVFLHVSQRTICFE
jgi:hypothetical protein